MATALAAEEFERVVAGVDGVTVTVAAPTPAPNEPAPILMIVDHGGPYLDRTGYAGAYLTKDQARAVAQALLQACEEAPNAIQR